MARLYPWTVEPGEELRLALDFLGRPVAPETILRAGYVAGVAISLPIGVSALLAPGELQLGLFLAALALGLLVTHAAHAVPKLWATAKRTSALGDAPDLVARAVLRMRLSPTPERAAAFSARTGDGVLAASLGKHIRQSRHTPAAGLVSFGDSWADLFPSLRRAVALVSAAGSAPEQDRDRLLDRALAVVMDGTRDEMQSFGARVRTPATALYAFGVLLPTALVALLPAGGAVGVAVTPLSVILLYNILLPAALVGAATWLLAGRPVAFPPPSVTSEHPEIPDRRLLVLGVAIIGGAIAAGVTSLLVPAWGPPITAVGIGVGLGLWLQHKPVVDLYDRISAVEQSLPDALTLIGRRVANGRAVETAIAQTGDELDSEIGVVLRDGVRRQKQLQVDVEEAFLGQHGALERVPSPRVRDSIAFISLATKEGRPAGTALLSLADHVEELQTIEQEARHSLAHVCRTLQTTGMVFAPMVAGATVSLAEGIGGEAFRAEGGQSLTWLGGPVGVYVLVLAVFLTSLSVGLTRGFDTALVSSRAGKALLCATITYLCSYLLVGLIL